ncbi:MAG TPA: hypothetical protein ENJ95_08830 [Bacteroidetes bacterium]|nr:hypothetical protein [Bacteroidota bacterium]
MKKLPFLFALFIFFTLNIAFGQEVEMEEMAAEAPKIDSTLAKPAPLDLPEFDLDKTANIFETEESMSKGLQNAIVVETEATNEKLVDKVWKKFMKDYGGKTKRAKGGKRGELVTTGAEIVGINGVNSMNVYSRSVTGSSGNVEQMVWFDLGDEYLGSGHGSQYKEAEAMLQKFAHEVRVEKTKQELKDSEKKLKNMESELKKLVHQNESYHKEIENYKKKIIEAEENIVKNDQQQIETNQKIELQNMLVEEIDRRLKALRKQ